MLFHTNTKRKNILFILESGRMVIAYLTFKFLPLLEPHMYLYWLSTFSIFLNSSKLWIPKFFEYTECNRGMKNWIAHSTFRDKEISDILFWRSSIFVVTHFVIFILKGAVRIKFYFYCKNWHCNTYCCMDIDDTGLTAAVKGRKTPGDKLKLACNT